MNKRHGYKTQEKTYPEYAIWSSIIQRCENKNNKAYNDYGGRGIKICPQWRKDFLNFLEDMGNKPSNKHTLDRIDNNKGYYKGNCKWVTMKEQSRNKRNNIYVIHKNKKMLLLEYAEVNNISYQAAYKRMERAIKSCNTGIIKLRDGTVVRRDKE